MVRALQQGNVENFAIMLEKFVLESISYFDVKRKEPERVLPGLYARSPGSYRRGV